MSELKNKTIITVATTGAWPTKTNNPNVPMTPEEIASRPWWQKILGALFNLFSPLM